MTVAERCESRTESEIIAAQDQELRTKYLETQISEKEPRKKVEQKQGLGDKEQHS